MAIWPPLLRDASFNGIAFKVTSSEIETGHRVNTTHVPNGRHINESFGPQARKITIEAYCAGDAAYARAEALVMAAEAQHRGLLILPDAGGRMVRLTKATRKFDKDKLGFAVVSIEATAEPEGIAGGYPADVLTVMLYGVADQVVEAAGVYAGAALVLAGVAAPVVDAALTSGAAALADLEALRLSARLGPVQDAIVSPIFSAALTALAALPVDPAGFGVALARAAIALGDVAEPLRLAHRIVGIGMPEASAPASVSTGTAVAIAAVDVSTRALTAACRALALGEALARQDYRDRAQAVETRTIAMAIFDDALARCGRAGLDLARSLAAMKGLVADLIFRRAADLAPLITVSVPARLPSLWWAWRLYGDPERADDLARRAGAGHPSFMPEQFEALAS